MDHGSMMQMEIKSFADFRIRLAGNKVIQQWRWRRSLSIRGIEDVFPLCDLWGPSSVASPIASRIIFRFLGYLWSPQDPPGNDPRAIFWFFKRYDDPCLTFLIFRLVLFEGPLIGHHHRKRKEPSSKQMLIFFASGIRWKSSVAGKVRGKVRNVPCVSRPTHIQPRSRPRTDDC